MSTGDCKAGWEAEQRRRLDSACPAIDFKKFLADAFWLKIRYPGALMRSH
jgi:hypothetical protein